MKPLKNDRLNTQKPFWLAHPLLTARFQRGSGRIQVLVCGFNRVTWIVVSAANRLRRMAATPGTFLGMRVTIGSKASGGGGGSSSSSGGGGAKGSVALAPATLVCTEPLPTPSLPRTLTYAGWEVRGAAACGQRPLLDEAASLLLLIKHLETAKPPETAAGGGAPSGGSGSGGGGAKHEAADAVAATTLPWLRPRKSARAVGSHSGSGSGGVADAADADAAAEARSQRLVSALRTSVLRVARALADERSKSGEYERQAREKDAAVAVRKDEAAAAAAEAEHLRERVEELQIERTRMAPASALQQVSAIISRNHRNHTRACCRDHTCLLPRSHVPVAEITRAC